MNWYPVLGFEVTLSTFKVFDYDANDKQFPMKFISEEESLKINPRGSHLYIGMKCYRLHISSPWHMGREGGGQPTPSPSDPPTEHTTSALDIFLVV